MRKGVGVSECMRTPLFQRGTATWLRVTPCNHALALALAHVSVPHVTAAPHDRHSPLEAPNTHRTTGEGFRRVRPTVYGRSNTSLGRRTMQACGPTLRHAECLSSKGGVSQIQIEGEGQAEGEQGDGRAR